MADRAGGRSRVGVDVTMAETLWRSDVTGRLLERWVECGPSVSARASGKYSRLGYKMILFAKIKELTSNMQVV
jgi:hypothetical protein